MGDLRKVGTDGQSGMAVPIDGDGEQVADVIDRAERGRRAELAWGDVCTVAALSAEGMGAGGRRWDGSKRRGSTRLL